VRRGGKSGRDLKSELFSCVDPSEYEALHTAALD
jgi:hypothetical protein